MSALGQKQTCAAQNDMSALPPIADINALFDHLIGASEQRWRHSEADRLSGLEVDDQFEFGGLLNRKITRFCTFKDLVSHGCRAPEQFVVIGGIGNEASRQ